MSEVTHQIDPHIPPWGIMTPELLEKISRGQLKPRYVCLLTDFIDECNGDNDAENIVVFKDTETGVIYRASWDNDGSNCFSDLEQSQIWVELAKEVTAITYKGVKVIQTGD